MKRKWTRAEKLLWATPILVGIFAAATMWGPKLVRGALGLPQIFATTSDTEISSMTLSGDGKILSVDVRRDGLRGWLKGSGTIDLWNVRTGEKLPPIAPVYTRGKLGYLEGWLVFGLALSPDARTIGFSRLATEWTLYDVATHKQLWRVPHFAIDARFSDDGKFIALSSGSSVTIVDASNGKARAQWKLGGSANSGDIAWSHDGKLVANIGADISNDLTTMQDRMAGIHHYDGSDPLEIHRADNGKLVRSIPNVNPYPNITSVAFSTDSKRLISASFPGNGFSKDDYQDLAPVRCFDAVTGKLQWEVTAATLGGADWLHASVGDAIFSPDGRIVAAYQNQQGAIFLLDSATGEVKSKLHTRNAMQSTSTLPPNIAFAPDGKRLFASGENAVLVWDLD